MTGFLRGLRMSWLIVGILTFPPSSQLANGPVFRRFTRILHITQQQLTNVCVAAAFSRTITEPVTHSLGFTGTASRSSLRPASGSGAEHTHAAPLGQPLCMRISTFLEDIFKTRSHNINIPIKSMAYGLIHNPAPDAEIRLQICHAEIACQRDGITLMPGIRVLYTPARLLTERAGRRPQKRGPAGPLECV